ncbi:MAG TPA: L,D-transpeptidase [Chthoniobacterales bacterium]
MRWGRGIFLVALAVACAGSAQAAPGYSVEIDLEQQTAYLIHGRRIVLATPISSGRAGHFTDTGSFKITEKERRHFSSLYGKIVDARGRTVVADADADMRVPRGGKFIPAPMSYFMRFDGATGMHAGYLPGYPASHGCVRLPERNAIAFFNAVEIGTPVHVFGRTPRTREYFRYGPQPARPLPQRPARPRFDPRSGPPVLERRTPGWEEGY